jgi:hypothetical protein
MKNSKIIACYLKGLNTPQSLVKKIANINTGTYHKILKGEIGFNDSEKERLGIVFPEIKQIKGDEDE